MSVEEMIDRAIEDNTVSGDAMRVKERCPGCVAAAGGADRLDYRHVRGCERYDAFYDATDVELASMIPMRPRGVDQGGC